MPNVFANGREISGQASNNKSIAAMADVCLSPPPAPTGPIPVPYPNTSMSSDTFNGSRTVEIGGKMAGLKNSSYYKKSVGDQPATPTLGQGFISHALQGATKHSAWSFDVEIEGQNVIRHLDLTTHNHQNPSNLAMTADFGAMALMLPEQVTCKELAAGAAQARDDMKSEDNTKGVQNVGDGSTTVAMAKFTSPGGVSGMMKACSRALVQKYDNGFSPGLTAADKAKLRGEDGKVKSNACPGAEHTYSQADSRPHTSHAESRLIESLLGTSNPPVGGTLTIAINWQNADGTADKPCENCQKLICAVTPACLEIFICKKGEPTPPDC